jgi:hypothetical protein
MMVTLEIFDVTVVLLLPAAAAGLFSSTVGPDAKVRREISFACCCDTVCTNSTHCAIVRKISCVTDREVNISSAKKSPFLF